MYNQPTWVSNSTITDSLKCPRAYFLKNIYKNERNRKIAVTSPALTLGQVVHEVLEPLAKISAKERFRDSILSVYENKFAEYKGLPGGFIDSSEEEDYFLRGRDMLSRVVKNPGPLLKPALRLTSKDELPPRYFLSTTDNILLCGKIDWLEYLPETDGVHIIDFKTGKHDEDQNSLQLPIYCLLVKNLQKRDVKKISYWYLERDDKPREMPLPDLDLAHDQVLKLALGVQKMRTERAYTCPKNGCMFCLPFESILKGSAKYIGLRGYQDIYMLDGK